MRPITDTTATPEFIVSTSMRQGSVLSFRDEVPSVFQSLDEMSDFAVSYYATGGQVGFDMRGKCLTAPEIIKGSRPTFLETDERVENLLEDGILTDAECQALFDNHIQSHSAHDVGEWDI